MCMIIDKDYVYHKYVISTTCIPTRVPIYIHIYNGLHGSSRGIKTDVCIHTSWSLENADPEHFKGWLVSQLSHSNTGEFIWACLARLHVAWGLSHCWGDSELRLWFVNHYFNRPSLLRRSLVSQCDRKYMHIFTKTLFWVIMWIVVVWLINYNKPHDIKIFPYILVFN